MFEVVRLSPGVLTCDVNMHHAVIRRDMTMQGAHDAGDRADMALEFPQRLLRCDYPMGPVLGEGLLAAFQYHRLEQSFRHGRRVAARHAVGLPSERMNFCEPGRDIERKDLPSTEESRFERSHFAISVAAML